MRTITVYRHGATMGTPPRKNDHSRVKRGEVSGWSESASRRNLAFLRSVDERSLDRDGFTGWTITLTIKDCPPDAVAWHKLRRAFIKRLERLGLLRCHWVVEWQKRGVPHLHGMIWLPSNIMPYHIIDMWCAVAAAYVCTPRGQHAAPVTDVVGWLKYLAKHAARGVKHYQRSSENMPEGWKGKTGRVWGHTGDWPLAPVTKLYLDDVGFFKMRRICRSWKISENRANYYRQKDRLQSLNYVSLSEREIRKKCHSYQIRVARRSLSCSDRMMSELMGVSEWVPQLVIDSAIAWIYASGHDVSC